MPVYQTPGVTYERVDVGPPRVTPLRTDIAGFVGIAARGPIDTPTPIQSWAQFVAWFGGFLGGGYLAYAVRAFLENGGRQCYVVRVASDDPGGGFATASAAVTGKGSGADFWQIAAFSPGGWGNALSVTLKETHRQQTMTLPYPETPNVSVVSSTSGFERGVMVRLTQGATVMHHVISDVDPIENRLIWRNPEPAARLPYDRALPYRTGAGGFDPDRPIVVESVEYTLIVWQNQTVLMQYENLTLIPEHPRYGAKVLAAFPISSEGILPLTPQPVTIRELRDLETLRLARPVEVEPLDISPDRRLSLTGGADGLALLTVRDFIGEDISPEESDEARRLKRRGLRALEEIQEVSILAVPDIQIQPVAVPMQASLPPCIPDVCLPPPALPPLILKPLPEPELPPVFSAQDIYLVQAAMIQQCEDLRDRFALIDPPWFAAKDDGLGPGAAQAWRSRFDTKFAAFYYPWILVVDPLRAGGAVVRPVPPCGHVAGQYARTDNEIGVYKAPANAPLGWAQAVTKEIGEAAHGMLNPIGINVIRTLPARGLRLFGARTLSSDPDWRYVNVRRLMMQIEKALLVSMQWAVFEPNDELTRIHIRLALTGFLLSLWQQGALMGATMQEAFFVKCDEENNPPRERDLGHLIADVGVAPSKPFEFIVVRVGRINNAFEITGP